MDVWFRRTDRLVVHPPPLRIDTVGSIRHTPSQRSRRCPALADPQPPITISHWKEPKDLFSLNSLQSTKDGDVPCQSPFFLVFAMSPCGMVLYDPAALDVFKEDNPFQNG
mmetsp:Transcript_28160/g.65142  ORF Transcript_28160/g.65142 Transcript_28160/m.65142 type:complete len:110 (-) Transcript_28160:1288-1617(-)